MIKELKLDFGGDVISAAYSQMDPLKKGEIYFMNFRNSLKEYVEQDKKQIAERIIAEISRNFAKPLPELMMNYTNDTKYISQDKLLQALRSKGVQITPKDQAFFLEELEVKKNIKDEIDYQELYTLLVSLAKRNNISIPQNFMLSSMQSSQVLNSDNTPTRKQKKKTRGIQILEDMKSSLNKQTSEELSIMFKGADKDRDKNLKFKEFEILLKKIRPGVDYSTSVEIFEALDVNDDQTISLMEFMKAFDINLERGVEDERFTRNQEKKSTGAFGNNLGADKSGGFAGKVYKLYNVH
jgi:Ca2+-binding EF-hand superfamily protein